jgi:hypothetical protein
MHREAVCRDGNFTAIANLLRMKPGRHVPSYGSSAGFETGYPGLRHFADALDAINLIADVARINLTMLRRLISCGSQ